MLDWQSIKVNSCIKIERCVGEFEVWDVCKMPYGKFKVKIYESTDGRFTGRTNLMVKDDMGNINSGIGYGITIADALNDTIKYFYSLIEDVSDISKDNFEYVEWMDF